MTPQQLADTLSGMHGEATYDQKTTMIRLFGILYADEIRDCGEPVTKIVARSSLRNTTYDNEISKGVKLARYVTVRPDWHYLI